MSTRALTPAKNSQSTQGRTGQELGSKSTQVQALSDGPWWTEEEARLYETWAASFGKYDEMFPQPYFDYFFTGQDIRVKIDALDDNDFLPVYAIGYQVEQQKMPLYGYASYVYDAMLRGTRIISGSFSLIVTEPFLLTRKIASAAGKRSQSTQNPSAEAIKLYDGDEENIYRYWNRTYDSGREVGYQHLFSIHPPFNLLIKYGMEETSLVSNNPDLRINEIKKKFKNNAAKWTNTNERLVQDNTARSTNILLENIELTTKAVQYDPSGDPIMETYSFLARDERMVYEPATMDVSGQLPRGAV